MLGKLDRGMRITAVGCHYGIKEDKLRGIVKAIVPTCVNISL